jgi:hypothetical protein
MDRNPEESRKTSVRVASLVVPKESDPKKHEKVQCDQRLWDFQTKKDPEKP